jgi:pimeloyl-ACP methyl ester carboxylesterase
MDPKLAPAHQAAVKERTTTRKRLLLGLAGVVSALAVGLLVAGYLATLPGMASAASRRLGAAPADLGLAAEVVSFPSRDGIALKGWWMPAQGAARGTVILAHGRDGNRSFMVSRAKFLVTHAYNAFPIDLRGHGESGGRYMTPGSLEALDILGAVDAARARGGRGPFVALGHSSGAVASLQAAARSPEIAAVIADGAFISPERVLERAAVVVGRDAHASRGQKLELRLANWFLHSTWGSGFVKWAFYVRTGVWVEPHDADALPAIARIGSRPILFIVGEQDAIAPPEDAQRMYEAALSRHKALLVVPGAGHNTTYGSGRELYEATVLRFLERLASGE